MERMSSKKVDDSVEAVFNRDPRFSGNIREKMIHANDFIEAIQARSSLKGVFSYANRFGEH